MRLNLPSTWVIYHQPVKRVLIDQIFSPCTHISWHDERFMPIKKLIRDAITDTWDFEETCKLSVFSLQQERQPRFSTRRCSTISFNRLERRQKKIQTHLIFPFCYWHWILSGSIFGDALYSLATDTCGIMAMRKHLCLNLFVMRKRKAAHNARISIETCVFAQFTVLVLIASCYKVNRVKDSVWLLTQYDSSNSRFSLFHTLLTFSLNNFEELCGRITLIRQF